MYARVPSLVVPAQTLPNVHAGVCHSSFGLSYTGTFNTRMPTRGADIVALHLDMLSESAVLFNITSAYVVVRKLEVRPVRTQPAAQRGE